MSGVQVLADGNPRQGGMDEDERDQCIHGVIRLFPFTRFNSISHWANALLLGGWL